MTVQRTFSIIKPDATRRNLTGKINAVIEENGLRIVAQRRVRLTTEQAKAFYEVHAGKPFYDELVEFMTSEPVVVQVLEGENAVTHYREVMGATNPEKAPWWDLSDSCFTECRKRPLPLSSPTVTEGFLGTISQRREAWSLRFQREATA